MRGSRIVTALAVQAIDNMNLPRNASKGSWEGLGQARAFALLLAEVRELAGALWRLHCLRRELRRIERIAPDPFDRSAWLAARDNTREAVEKARQHAKHEAGDCASFLAIIMDGV
jgi:hypothetical protein